MKKANNDNVWGRRCIKRALQVCQKIKYCTEQYQKQYN